MGQDHLYTKDPVDGRLEGGPLGRLRTKSPGPVVPCPYKDTPHSDVPAKSQKDPYTVVTDFNHHCAQVAGRLLVVSRIDLDEDLMLIL